MAARARGRHVSRVTPTRTTPVRGGLRRLLALLAVCGLAFATAAAARGPCADAPFGGDTAVRVTTDAVPAPHGDCDGEGQQLPEPDGRHTCHLLASCAAGILMVPSLMTRAAAAVHDAPIALLASLHGTAAAAPESPPPRA
jgi:hypothetical protein